MSGKSDKELFEITDKICDLEKQRIEIDTKGLELEEKISHIESQIELEILFDIDEKGKLRYSNEKSRQSALKLRLHDHADYQSLKQQIQELRTKDRLLAIECIRLKAHYQILLAFSAHGVEGRATSFPSLQFEDLDLLARSTDLPEKIQRLARFSVQEPSAVNTQLSEKAKQESLEIENQIARLSSKEEEINGEQRKLSDQIQAIQDQTTLEVAGEKDAKSKPVYANEGLRETAVRVRLRKNTAYQRLLESLHKLDGESDKLTTEINKLREQKRAIMSDAASATSPPKP